MMSELRRFSIFTCRLLCLGLKDSYVLEAPPIVAHSLWAAGTICGDASGPPEHDGQINADDPRTVMGELSSRLDPTTGHTGSLSALMRMKIDL